MSSKLPHSVKTREHACMHAPTWVGSPGQLVAEETGIKMVKGWCLFSPSQALRIWGCVLCFGRQRMCMVSTLKRGLAVVKWHGASCTCALIALCVREMGLLGVFCVSTSFPNVVSVQNIRLCLENWVPEQTSLILGQAGGGWTPRESKAASPGVPQRGHQ